MIRRLLACACLLSLGGCSYLPEVVREPTIFNPFPQLQRVAVLPFINHSAEPSVDGRIFALAYYNELQNIPGFEVVPFTIVETVLREYQMSLNQPVAGQIDARRLAQLLEVDAVVIGAVTDYSPYYPPRVAMRVEWYAANPCFHPIPPGYGLPWGTPAEEDIPPPIVYAAELTLAREQMATQEPAYQKPDFTLPPAPLPPPPDSTPAPDAPQPPGTLISHATEAATASPAPTPGTTVTALPHNWPDPRGLTPLPPSAAPPPCRPTNDPVLRHTASYNGHDARVTAALATYVYFRDDARFGGWQGYLQRSDDFIRFCCRMHLAEMLTARGGAGESRVAWRWPTSR